MGEIKEALDREGWSKHYNINKLNAVVESIRNENVQVWAKELLNICEDGSKCLEIGCGTGISSLWLAKNGRKVTAIDYTNESVELVNEAARKLSINLDVICCDAREPLPFEKRSFDYSFQAGLLEHFDLSQQIELLKMWSQYSKRIISMIPNAASLPYRVGKKIMEDNNTWPYGLEIPRHSMIESFVKAGIEVEREYTIGAEWALGFLPQDHYLRHYFELLVKDGYELEDYMQGYLLVTIGNCNREIN